MTLVHQFLVPNFCWLIKNPIGIRFSKYILFFETPCSDGVQMSKHYTKGRVCKKWSRKTNRLFMDGSILSGVFFFFTSQLPSSVFRMFLNPFRKTSSLKKIALGRRVMSGAMADGSVSTVKKKIVTKFSKSRQEAILNLNYKFAAMWKKPIRNE